jgi:hypothetical protein
MTLGNAAAAHVRLIMVPGFADISRARPRRDGGTVLRPRARLARPADVLAVS